MDPSSPDRPAARAAVLVAAVVLVVAGAGGPAVAQSGGAGAPLALSQAQVDADAVLLAVDLRADGTATWRVEYRVLLDDDNATAAFEDLQADVETNESAYVTRFADRMETTVADAAETTGREMAVRNVSVTTATEQLPQSYGVLVYRFEWTGFAVLDGDRLRAGDALVGLFLDGDSSLLLSWPEGYAVVDVAPEPTEQRERSVVWRGPLDFGPGEPNLVLSSSAGGGFDASFAGLAVVLAVLLGGGALWWWRYRASPGDEETGGLAPAGGSSSAPPEELLSNEERVVALVEEHGGRMKQQDVVEALGWTDAKTSQVVGKLRDAGELEGFRLGRENVLRLPEVDGSPAPGEVSAGGDDDDADDG